METLKKLHVSKYDHTDIIWLATNEQGEYPVLFVPLTFLFLVGVMSLCLYYFFKFQEFQEELAGIIHDNEYTKEREEQGIELVVEKDSEQY